MHGHHWRRQFHPEKFTSLDRYSSFATITMEFLRRIVLPPGEGEYGMGHDAASGGSLPLARWNQLLAALGFPAATFAAPARDAA